jgi:hypothetical protein
VVRIHSNGPRLGRTGSGSVDGSKGSRAQYTAHRLTGSVDRSTGSVDESFSADNVKEVARVLLEHSVVNTMKKLIDPLVVFQTSKTSAGFFLRLFRLLQRFCSSFLFRFRL